MTDPSKVLVVFNTVCLYGMERSVIETFEMLRPEVQPLFLLNRANLRHRTPLLEELKRSRLPFRFFHDMHDWPRFGMPHSIRQVFGMLAALIEGNLDVLHAACGADALYLPIVTSAYISVLAALWFRFRGRKVIYFFHDLPSAYSAKLRPAVALSTDLVHYAQSSLKLAAAGNPFVLGRPNSVIPPAIRIRENDAIVTCHDPDSLVTSRHPDSLATSHGPDAAAASRQPECNIVFAGQVAPHKGVDLLIDAFNQLAARYQGLHLTIAGGVYGEHRPWFEASLRTSAHSDRIHYLGYRDDIQQILKSAYVLAIPTRPSRFHESFGRVAAEAMAAGVPSVCFKSGALEEVVVNRETGLVCELESAGCLAANLEELIRRPDFRDACGRKARLRYEERYSEHTVRRGWLHLLERGAPA